MLRSARYVGAPVVALGLAFFGSYAVMRATERISVVPDSIFLGMLPAAVAVGTVLAVGFARLGWRRSTIGAGLAGLVVVALLHAWVIVLVADQGRFQ